MAQRSRTQRRPSTTPTTTPGLRSLLVPVDLTPASDRVIARIAHLPLTNDARITLLHVVPDALPIRDQRSAERDAKKVLPEEARQLARALPRSVRVEAVVRVGVAHKVIAEQASQAGDELVVMGRGGGRAVRDTFLGSTAERVIRRGQLPVLVVRLPARGPYRRPALALDLDDAVRSAFPLALRVLPSPRPLLTVIHAYSTAYHGLVYPSLSDDADLRREIQQRVSQELSRLLLSSLAEASPSPGDVPLWKLVVRYGSPRAAIEKAVEKADADLLVLGTRAHSGLAHALLGTVAGDVLRSVRCDVLVVPPRATSSEPD